MPELTTTLDYLYGLHTRGIKLGLDRVEAFLAGLGNPHRAYPTVHIAGTNGKGSTSTLIYRALQAQGVRCGLYTSPHLLRFNERIIVDNVPVPDKAICAFVDKHRTAFDKHHLTFFEITTALAFDWFQEQKVKFAVIETGMGGRLDATNVLLPEVTVITDISMDHTEFLGSRIVDIATEKSGIIKPGVPLVFGIDNPRAREVVMRIAMEKGAPFTDTQVEYHVELLKDSPEGMTFNAVLGNKRYDNLFIPLSGGHQLKNAMMALGALTRLSPSINDSAIQQGFARAKVTGRLDYRKGTPDILYDVSHNVKGIFALNAHLERHFAGRRTVIVFGVMADKNYGRMFQLLSGQNRELIVTQPHIERAKNAEALVNEAGAGRAVPSVPQALDEAKQMAGPEGLVVVAGSFYTVAEAMEAEASTQKAQS
ncbi:MAG: folylpolyglutamate synthase/dihydrofolate synthase family protein [Fibrobacterota bacterium]